MRYKHPTIGDIRVKARFLFLPKRINNETRWLEYAKWEEIYTLMYTWRKYQWLNT